MLSIVRLRVLRLLLGIVVLLFTNFSQALIVLDDNSQYSDAEVGGIREGEDVFALTNHDGKGYVIEKAKIKFEKNKDEEYGNITTVSSNLNALFYIKGMDLKTGPIDAVQMYNFLIKFGETKKLPMKIKGTISISGEKVFDNKEKPKEFSIKNYTITIDVNGAKASIVDTQTEKLGLGISFLGDINRDGYPDVYIVSDRLEKEGTSILYMSEYKNKKYSLNKVFEH